MHKSFISANLQHCVSNKMQDIVFLGHFWYILDLLIANFFYLLSRSTKRYHTISHNVVYPPPNVRGRESLVYLVIVHSIWAFIVILFQGFVWSNTPPPLTLKHTQVYGKNVSSEQFRIKFGFKNKSLAKSLKFFLLFCNLKFVVIYFFHEGITHKKTGSYKNHLFTKFLWFWL